MENKVFNVLLPMITADITNKLMKINNYKADEALKVLRKSKTYEMLEKEETKFWHLSNEQIMRILLKEIEGNFEIPEV